MEFPIKMKNPPAHLLCEIHGGMLIEPVRTPKCNHLFCRQCIVNWMLLQGQCPHDANRFTADQLLPDETVQREIEIAVNNQLDAARSWEEAFSANVERLCLRLGRVKKAGKDRAELLVVLLEYLSSELSDAKRELDQIRFWHIVKDKSQSLYEELLQAFKSSGHVVEKEAGPREAEQDSKTGPAEQPDKSEQESEPDHNTDSLDMSDWETDFERSRVEEYEEAFSPLDPNQQESYCPAMEIEESDGEWATEEVEEETDVQRSIESPEPSRTKARFFEAFAKLFGDDAVKDELK